MKTIVKWFATKYVIGIANDVLAQYKDNVEEVTKTLGLWIGRLEKILNLLKCLNARVDDGKIDSDEVEESLDEIKDLVKTW